MVDREGGCHGGQGGKVSWWAGREGVKVGKEGGCHARSEEGVDVDKGEGVVVDMMSDW